MVDRARSCLLALMGVAIASCTTLLGPRCTPVSALLE
jgi:hypothetical protein